MNNQVMDIDLMSTFEKYAFPDAKADKKSYYMAAPSAVPDEAALEEDDFDLIEDDLQDFDDIEEDDDLGTIEDDYPPETGDEELLAEQPTTEESAVEEGLILLGVRNLNKIYKQGGNKLHVLNNVDLRLYSGEITALVGPSGSGKSTLLHMLGLLDSPTSGQIMMKDQDVSKLSDRTRTKLRNEHIGFVYQFHHLLPEFSAIENVALPQIIAGQPKQDAEEKAADLLGKLGLSHRINHRPATLSGGEQQRVAIARALVNDPLLLFADEPTGNLDPETAEEVFELLLDLVRSRGIGALIATHNLDLANEMDRILEVKSGRILPY